MFETIVQDSKCSKATVYMNTCHRVWVKCTTGCSSISIHVVVHLLWTKNETMLS